MPEYEPELGQMCFGCPTGRYECPKFVEAFIHHIVHELDRVIWNVTQKEFDHYKELKLIPKLEFRPYCWDEDTEEAALPNLRFEDVEVRWYKHIGRGMSLNVEKTEYEWRMWLDRCLVHILGFEREYSRSQGRDVM